MGNRQLDLKQGPCWLTQFSRSFNPSCFFPSFQSCQSSLAKHGPRSSTPENGVASNACTSSRNVIIHPPTPPIPTKPGQTKKTWYLRQPATKNIQKQPYNNINNIHRENYVKKQLLHTHHTFYETPRNCQAKGWCSGKPMAEHIVPLVMPLPPLSLSLEFFFKSWGWWNQPPSNHHQVIWITRNNKRTTSSGAAASLHSH